MDFKVIEMHRVTDCGGNFAIVDSLMNVEVFANRKHVNRRLKQKAYRWIKRFWKDLITQAKHNVAERNKDHWETTAFPLG